MSDKEAACSDERPCNPCFADRGFCENKKAEFEAKAKELINWLCANGHPHMTIVITPTSAELLEGCIAIQTDEFLRD